MADFFEEAEGHFTVPDQGGGFSTPDDAPVFDWDGFTGNIIGVLPGVIDAVNGSTPPTIIYEVPDNDNEPDYTMWLFGFMLMVVIIVVWVVIKNKR